ncbi:MAG: DNA-directed RNA polymerase subunit beta' [Chloroflexi bacterium]|nr:DNA-directed RNA polymerase subunit beta' [Chloroflexota bacterium]
MAEANDFKVVRISLASPEQIRSWSYGEVTKPETINYRTLKPEKDGLFCERIFGPTKDFECYCGKYKRQRYKGMICDKCGVEVARASVRRERMGHIELAAPVSHVWFAKGTPSRIGLLLDLSPRSLERVLYFAQYIVTSVDREALKAIREEKGKEYLGQLGAIDKELNDKIEEVKARTAAETASLESEKDRIMEAAQAELDAAIKEITDAAEAVEEKLKASQGKKAGADISFDGATILARGKVGHATHLNQLKQIIGERVAEKEEGWRQETEEKLAPLMEQLAPYQAKADEEIGAVKKEFEEKHLRTKQEHEDRAGEIGELEPNTLLPDARYRELREKYGNVFSAGMGAEAVLEILRNIDLSALRQRLLEEIRTSSGQRRKKAHKRLRVIEALRRSGNRPEWMVMTVLPVLPPDLRPMVQLDGGRFATSDLNDLYRRVINRNNRLRRLKELEAPDIIIRNEKRMLQEAVDSLIDNGKRGRAVSLAGSHKLKSLSDMLRGKQGRFRQNLLGKRVDYSGRSVIIVGPELQLHQCGLPRRMALELFKPFIMHRLVAQGAAHNIKSARRLVEKAKPEVWDILEDVIKQRPVMLNRAPTLHRLGIQAFEPVLIDGSAIQIHPMVCTAFNADFDGDQMAVHVPLSTAAVQECRQAMLSINNMLLPSSGDPVVAPTLDIVLGCYYLTTMKPGEKGEGKSFGSFNEAKMAYESGALGLKAPMRVRHSENGGKWYETSVGRIIFNEVLPAEWDFTNDVMDKGSLKKLVARVYKQLGNIKTAKMLDAMKTLGFHYATQSGITVGIYDLEVPAEKQRILDKAEEQIANIQRNYNMGLMVEEERYNQAIKVWEKAKDKVQDAVKEALSGYGGIYMMATAGAKGNIGQITQMAGMRGLMSDPSGKIIELPIKGSFREGLSVLEYFISTHGARKGLADTALRTSDSGYLTRRLIDVAQDVRISQEDCGSSGGIAVPRETEESRLVVFADRLMGRWPAQPVADPNTGEIIADVDSEIDEEKAAAIARSEVDRVYVRSVMTCQSRRGVCRKCYGRDLAKGELVKKETAVGIIAAQSIGEPGTQLTMRTFHTGGVVGIDITSGLPRVEELFEARIPKGQAIISEIDGVADIVTTGEERKIKVTSSELYRDEYSVPPGYAWLVKTGDEVEVGAALAAPEPGKEPGKELQVAGEAPAFVARVKGTAEVQGDRLTVHYEEKEEREYSIPVTAHVRVENGSRVLAGTQLTDGHINPQDILRIQGREKVQEYLVSEVQRVYRSQGVNINNKHIEVIARQMLGKVRVESPGDTELLPGELKDRFGYEDINARILAQGGEPATAQTVLLGVTRASLNTESWLAAASFQETTRVLAEAAVFGKKDRLLGLKENVIIGKLIPAQFAMPPAPVLEPVAGLPEAGPSLESGPSAGEERPPRLVERDTEAFPQ